ncbi:WEB family protein At3g02930, chloroplastic-like isoform X2 [Dioscorea cayenensis subsp. rotundata]|uniref:WEB family protein At3g02930, chloroplastic-like isoform X2 n=1 Tax=Dioscorea cayennensis subsp. rotundata TaxID=55577 RepID=A0AB40CQT7_DIOCR|nr:WEB family protein At3g02930, chloroplastic-like isoform X2 [Dioscorea cayenensis subsp. rotundata]
MLGSKSKSGLSEASSNKTTPATPRVSKIGRAGSAKTDSDLPSPMQIPRLSIDRSPRSIESKPAVERRATKMSSTPPDQSRPLKASELQAQLNAVQDDLKKAKERFALVEKEKTQALEELKDAKRLAEEANEKLQEALVAKKKAEEGLEIEKFRADELEQAGIEAAQKRDEEWQKELENVQSQHTMDVSALLSTTQELQRVKHELVMTTDAKNTALSHADDAMKIAEINAEKVEILSGEVNRLKALLDSKLESKSSEAAEQVKQLDLEILALKQELEKAKAAEEKLVQMEALIERLRIEVIDVKKAESEVSNLVDEWKKKAELLESRVDEATQSEKSSLDSLASAQKQLEDTNASLQDAESEIGALKGKVESLEIEVAMYKQDLEESNRFVDLAKQEAVELGKTVEVLKSDLKTVEEEKLRALNNEKVAASNMESLSDEKEKLANELEMACQEGEKVKRAMEGLTSALHEASAEARDTQERLLMKQAEVESCRTQIEELQLALKNTQESCEVKLDEAKYDVVCLRNSVEKYETEARSSKAEWDEKESSFVNAVRKSEEEIVAIKLEMSKAASSLEAAKLEVQTVKGEGVELLSKLRKAESDLSIANKTVEETKAESLQLKEKLLDRENEVQSITQENDELRCREAAAQEKVKELSALLADAIAKKDEENCEFELSKSEKEYELLPDAAEIPKEDTEKPMAKEDLKVDEFFREESIPKEEKGNAYAEEAAANAGPKMWESCKITDKDLSPEREHEAESIDDDNDSKTDTRSFEQTNGLPSEDVENGSTSPTKQQQKKKKPLLQKFGSLLKKKNNHK